MDQSWRLIVENALCDEKSEFAAIDSEADAKINFNIASTFGENLRDFISAAAVSCSLSRASQPQFCKA